MGFEKSMWTVTIDGARILLGARIDDFVIACANRKILDGFRAHLLDAFEGTYEGKLQHYLGCEVTCDIANSVLTSKTLRTIIWYKRACIRQTTPTSFYRRPNL